MSKGKVLEGVFALNKPTGISSAQALRDLQHHFNPSRIFASWLEMEKANRSRESHYQRNRRRKKLIEVKVGHGGTLDPLATGVLIVGLGKGTRALQNFLECTKTYETVVLFGSSTDTYDRVGRILKHAPHSHLSRKVVEEALAQFRGKFMQLPPLYSALKMNGKPLYEYAREGKEIPREIKRREVDVIELELIEWMEGGTHEHRVPTNETGKTDVAVSEKEACIDVSVPAGANKRKFDKEQDTLVSERPSKRRASISTVRQEEETISTVKQEEETTIPEPPTQDTAVCALTAEISQQDTSPPGSSYSSPPAARLRMTVSSGFYVRSLCHDLGEAVNSAALMAELTRVRQGEFELGKNVLEYADLEKGEDIWGPKVEAMLDKWAGDYRPFVTERPEEGIGKTGEAVTVSEGDKGDYAKPA